MKPVKKETLTTRPVWLSEEWPKWFFLFLFIFLFVIPFILLQPLSSLDRQGHLVMAAFALTLVSWIVHPKRLPRGLTGLFFLGLVLAVAGPALIC